MSQKNEAPTERIDDKCFCERMVYPIKLDEVELIQSGKKTSWER